MANEKSEPSFVEEAEKAEPLTATRVAPLETSWAQLEWMEQERAKDRQVLTGLLKELLQENRLMRRGRLFVRVMLVMLLAGFFAYKVFTELDGIEQDAAKAGHTAVVHVKGVLMSEAEASAEHVISGLNDAFANKNTKGVILLINSPGGSAVQSGMIHDEVQRLKKLHPTIPIYAAVEDICASGGYYIASSAKEIYVDKASLVGSIGVLMENFGFVDTIQKLGIENRTLTAGENKSFMDPFSPIKEKERLHAQALLDKIHAQFIRVVREGRGGRLKASDSDLFGGLVWTGEEAVQKGLVDGLGSAAWIAREQIKAPKIIDFTLEEEWYDRLSKKMVSTLVQQTALHSMITLR